ncbi:YqeB family protein [Streptomyces hoynatensis]|uniref:DUF308 domain-containing protein n=1 Tax=Streptomyces hoynatensis TaxID=1141874 RepID=A0A3A9YP49_9ACTN|nr:hypothetical protein [Streptomyces hoynatensis]RKN37911.1 hypothetical protein D7294_26460 [Streptomyces hoynatensis]
MSSEAREETTVLGLPVGDRVVLFAGIPVLGALIGLCLPWVAERAAGVRWLPGRGPLRVIASHEGPWTTAGLCGAGLLVGLCFGAYAAHVSLRVTLTDAMLRSVRAGRERCIARPEVDAVFLDGKQLVLLDRESRQLLSDRIEAPPKEVARAFTAHGYPWVKGDPYAGLYRRWVPETPDLPPAVNALLKARQVALEKKAEEETAELRAEVERLGYVVRDRSARQYWRPLVRS